MNKIALYVTMILLFLGLSKNFSPTEQNIPYVVNEQVFPSVFKGGPLTIILEDSFYAGLIIKTYFHKYRLIHAFHPPHSVIVRTSKRFWERCLPMHGMSLFRRHELQDKISLTPMPPGTLYIGDPAYGRWQYSDSGDRVWRFHNAYRDMPENFGWDQWIPNYDFFKASSLAENTGNAFFGLQNEFGTEGKVSKKSFPMPLYNTRRDKSDWNQHIKGFFKVPFKKRQG